MFKLILLTALFISTLLSQTNDNLVLQLRWKNQFQFAGFLIAKEKGFYKDVGLQVDIKEATNNTNPTEDVLNGKAHFGIQNSQIIYDRLKGKPVVALFSIYEKSPLVLLSLKNKNIFNLNDLNDKKIAHPDPSNVGSLQITMFLESSNIDYEKSSIKFGKYINELINNKVDLISVYATNQPFVLKEKGFDTNIIDPSNYGFDFYGDMLFTSQEMIDKQPDVVKKFYEASLKGWKYAYENLAESVDIIYKKYNSQNKSKEALLFEAKASISYIGDINNFGKLNHEKIYNIANLFAQNEPSLNIEDKLDYFIYENKLFLGNKNLEPLIFMKNDKPTGVIIDIVNEVIKEAGIKANIKTMNWAKAQDKINSNNADALIQININEERKKLYDFSYPLLTSNFHLFTQTNRIDIYDIESLKGKTIGVESKGYPIAILKKYPEINIHIISSWKDGFKLLEQGKLDGIFVDKLIGDYTISKNNIRNISSKDIPLDTTYSHIAVKKGNKELLEKINNGLTAITKNGKKEEILNKWSFINKPINIQLNKTQQEFLERNNIFKVCTRFNQYPISGEKDGKVIGIFGKVFDRLSESLNVEFKAVASNSDEDFVFNIKNNKCDFVSDLTKGYTGFKNIKTTETSIMKESFVAIGNIELPYFENIEKYTDFTFYVSKKVHEKILRQKYPNLNIKLLQNEELIMEEILEDINNVYVNLATLSDFTIQKYGIDKFKIVNIFETITGLGSIGVNINRVPEMLSIVDKTLKSYDKQTFYDIASSYKIKSYVVEKDYNIFLLYAFVILSVLGGILYYRQKILENQNKIIQENEKKWELAIEGNGDGFWDWNLQTNKVYYSKKWKEMLGFKEDEISNSLDEWKNRLHPDDKEKVCKNNYNYLEGKTSLYHDEYRILCKDGTYKWILDHGVIIERTKDGKPLRFIGTHVDISDRVKLEETAKSSEKKALKLKDIADTEKENAMLALEEYKATQEAMQIVQEELRQANEAKSEFLANMSHEIRTPLAGIIGITDILLDEVKSPKIKENLTIIKNSSNTLKNIINDVLDFSKIQSGKFQIIPREFSLRDMLKDIEALFRPQINSKGIDFVINIDDTIYDSLLGDSLRLHQIFNNLIGNSIKFTQKGRIEVDVKKLYESDNSIKLEFIIKDTGIGIEEKIQSKIFESFTQGELSNTKSYQGTGLGLAITKSLIDLMHGKIRFISALGVGTSFYFNLEFKKVENFTKDSVSKINSEGIFNGKVALVAEDSQINQIVAKRILSKMGFEVHIANDGEEAVDAVRKQNYDVVYMDIQMPNMDGYEATQKIRVFNKEVPIIALSAAVQDIDRKNSIEVGMNDHLKKPIENNELIQTTLKYIQLENKLNIDGEKEDEIKDETREKTDFFSHLFQEYGEETANTLLKTFYEQYKNIEEDIKKLNEEQLDKYIHKLKGSSGSLKFNEVYETSKIAREKNLDKEFVNKVVSEVKKVLNEIKMAVPISQLV